MASKLNGPVFAALQQPEVFEQVRLDEYGVPTWPNGTDIAPDALYDRLRGRGEQAASE